MSYQTQQTYRWPSPPAPCTSRKVTYDSPTSSISPLSARRQHEHAVPVGTVASRVKHLQKMQNAHTPRHLSPIPRDHDHAGRATLGQRISHRSAEPASISSRPDQDPQVDYFHSYLGQRSSRTNHKEDHSLLDSNRPKDQTNSYGSQIGTHAISEQAQHDTGNVRHVFDKRKMSKYNREMREYSQHEMDKIGEVHGSSTSYISPHPEPLGQAKQAPHGTASTKDTTSTNRHESVRDLFKEYGISRPAGLVPSSEPTPEHSVLEDSNPTEDTNRSLPVSSQTPIADRFMYGEQNTEPTSHVPLQPLNDEDNYGLQHTCRPSSTKKHVSKIPKTSLEQKMARAEVARHQKAKEVHIRKKKTLPMDYTPQVADHTRQDMSYAEGVSDHLSTPTKDNEHGHGHGHKHRHKKPSARHFQKTSDPFKDHYPESAQEANSHLDVRTRLNLPEQLGSKELQDKQTQKHVGSASNHNTAPSEHHHSDKSKIHQEKHTKPQGRKLAHQQQSQQHETSSRRNKQPKHNTARPSHRKPLIETHAKPQRYDDTQRIQPHIAPSRIYSQATSQTPYEGMPGERSVSKNSMMIPKRANRSQYFTTPEQPIKIQHDFQMSKADEDSSILVSPSPILRVLPVEQVPRLESPKHDIHQSHQREHRRSKSSSGVLSRDSPMSPCESSSCRATHSGHKPYRHSISCTEKRHQKHEGDIDCAGTLSEAAHADGQQRSPCKHQEDEQLPHGHSSRQDRESNSSRQEIVTTPQTFVIVEQCRNCSGFVDLCHHCPDICQDISQNRRGVGRPNEDERVSTNRHNLASRRTQANTSPIPAPLRSSNSSAHSRSWSRNSKPLSIASPAYPVTLSTFSLPESSGEEYEALVRNKNSLKASAVTHSQNDASVKSKSPLNLMSKYPSIGGASGPMLSPKPKRETLSPSWAQSSVTESAQATDAQQLNISQESTTSISKIRRTQDQQDEALGFKSEPKPFPSEHSDASSLIPVQSSSPIANQVSGDRQQLPKSDSSPETSTQRQVESFTSTENRKGDLAAKPPHRQSKAQPIEETAKEIRMPYLAPVITKKRSYKITESSDTDSSHPNEAVRRFSQYVQTKANDAGKFPLLPPETIGCSKREANSPERHSNEYDHLTRKPNDSETEKPSDKQPHPEPGDTKLRTTGEIFIEQMEMANKTYETASPEQLTKDAKPLPKRRSISSAEPSQQFDLQSVGQRETGSWLKKTGSSEQFVYDHRSLEKYQSTSNAEDSIVRRRMKQETRPTSPTTDDLLPRSKSVSTRSSSTKEMFSKPMKESRSLSPAREPSPKEKLKSASPTKEKVSPKLEQESRSPSPIKERASPEPRQKVKSSSSVKEQPSPKQISRSASPAKEELSPKSKQESRSPSPTKERLSSKREREVRSSISAKEKLSSKPTSRKSTAVYTVMDQPPTPKTSLPTQKTLDPQQQFPIPPTSKPPVPKSRSATYHTVQSVPDHPFVKEDPEATPQVPQRRTFRPQLPSSRPQTSMERAHKGPLLATRSHTSLESYPRTPSPGTPSIGAASASISRPRTPAYKTTAKRLTPPDVRKEDKKSTSKSVQRRISAFFQIKEKKSIPTLNQKLQQQLEEQKRKKSGDSNIEKDSESKRSKGLKMRNIDDRNKDRKISLKLRQPKESDPDTKQGALKEDDTDSMAVQHSEGQGFDEVQAEPRVEHRLEDDDCEDEKHIEQPVEQQLEDDGEEIEEASGSQDVGLESLSERRKGQDVESSMGYPSLIDEIWTLRMVGYDTPENERGSKEIESSHELSPPMPRQQSPQKPNQQGLVSSRVRDWDRELAILEVLSKVTERGTLRNNVPSGRKSKQGLQTSTDAYHTAKSRNQPPAQEEDCDQPLVESPTQINRADDMHSTDDDEHYCVWKAMYISQRDEGVKASMGSRSPSKMRDSYADEAEEASYEEKFGILGVTVVVHRRGREDLIVKTDLSDQ